MICQNCSVEFDPPRSDAKFCSRTCAQMARRSRIEFTCSWCEKVFLRNPGSRKNSKSGLHFCNRTCKEAAQRIGGLEDIQPDHYGTSLRNYREIMFRLGKMKSCENCGFERNPRILQVHHKDGNHENNTVDNLMVVCPNCHAEFHLSPVP